MIFNTGSFNNNNILVNNNNIGLVISKWLSPWGDPLHVHVK